MLAGAALLGGLFGFSRTAVLAENGKAKAEIVLGANPVTAAQFAALELQAHLQAMTGAEFPIVDEGARTKGAYPIFVGATKESVGKYDPAKFSEQGYVIDVDGDRTILFGRDNEATQKVSVEQFSKDVKKLIADRNGNVSLDDLKPDLAKRFGLADLTQQETELLRKALKKDIGFVKTRLKDTTAHDVRRRYVFAQAVKNVLNARAGVGWSSGSHTALPTLTTAKGAGAEMLVGMTENSDLGTRLKALLR